MIHSVSDLAKAGGRAFNRLIIVHAERQTNGLAQVRYFGQVGGQLGQMGMQGRARPASDAFGKGQLISKCLFGVIVSTKIAMKIL